MLTTLERAVAEHVERGGRFRKQGGFILVEYLPWASRAFTPSPPATPEHS